MKYFGVYFWLAALAAAVAGAQSNVQRSWDAAWKAALAITNDPADLAKTQSRVISYGIELGISKEVLEYHARQIEGWRGLAALAELAVAHAGDGNDEASRRLALDVFYRAPALDGDNRERALKAVMWALAAAGERDILLDTADRLTDGSVLKNTARAALALLDAVNTGCAPSRETLAATLQGHPEDISALHAQVVQRWSRFGEKRDIAQRFQQAWSLTADTVGYRRTDVRLEILDKLGTDIPEEMVRDALDKIASEMDRQHVPVLVRGEHYAALARLWGRLGDLEQTRYAASNARACAETLELIERPRLLARAAVGLERVGLTEEAQAWFGESLQIARDLINLRPRAIALADVYLAMAEANVSEDILRAGAESQD